MRKTISQASIRAKDLVEGDIVKRSTGWTQVAKIELVDLSRLKIEWTSSPQCSPYIPTTYVNYDLVTIQIEDKEIP